jgi:hypothetical protein
MFQYMGTKIHIITCESQIPISRCSGQCRKQSNMNFQVYWLCFAAQLLCRNVHQVLHIPVHIVASRVGLHLQSRSFPTEGVKGNPTLIEKGEESSEPWIEKLIEPKKSMKTNRFSQKMIRFIENQLIIIQKKLNFDFF